MTLEDGTHASLQVAAVRADGRAFVFLPRAMITLSGTGVTPHTARAIARSLRPL